MKLYDPCLRISAGNDPTEQYAAGELQKYLRLITGVTIPFTGKETEHKKTIFIGSAAPLTESDRNLLKFDGFIIRTLEDDCLILSGNKPASSLYAVYSLLENWCGCGFFEDGEQVPANPSLNVGKIDVIDNPRFEYRVFIVNTCTQYSELMWNNAEETITLLNRLAKKRINALIDNGLFRLTTLHPDTLQDMGYDVQATEYQKERTEVLEQACRHARLIGIDVASHMGILQKPDSQSAVEMKCACDQTRAFLCQYEQKNNQPLPRYTFEWCSIKMNFLDVRYEEPARYFTTFIRLGREKFHLGHLYFIEMPSEGSFTSDCTLEECGQFVIESYQREIGLIRSVDPEAVIFSSTPFPYCKTYKYQLDAVRGQDVILIETFLNIPGRKYDYQLSNYHDGKKWMSGTLSHCGRATNPCGDLRFALWHIQSLAADPRAAKMIAFSFQNEKYHRIILANDMYYALSWNPDGITLDDFIIRFTRRRYGDDALLPAVRDIVETLYSSANYGKENSVLYRQFYNEYRCGLVADSVKISIGYIPQFHHALELMLEQACKQILNPMFRFDLADYFRTYLGFFFNLYLAGARLGGYFGNLSMIDEYAAKALGVMDDIAKVCGTHEEFRLQTYYDWSKRFPPMDPDIPDSNTRNVYRMFTNLLPEDNNTLTDYMSEDFAELVAHYYKPQICAYLEDIRNLVKSGSRISGKTNSPNRLNDFAPPKGNVKWSAFGAAVEDDIAWTSYSVRRDLIMGPVIKDTSLIFDGDPGPMLSEIFARYPVSEEIEKLLKMDPLTVGTGAEDEDPILSADVGDETAGINRGIIVEQVYIHNDVLGIFDCTVLGKEYNIYRGEIERIRVRATDFVNFKRVNDIEAPDRNGMVRQFLFNVSGVDYIMSFDEGSENKPASIFVDKLDDKIA